MDTLVLYGMLVFRKKSFRARSETAQFRASIIVLDSVLVFHPHVPVLLCVHLCAYQRLMSMQGICCGRIAFQF